MPAQTVEDLGKLVKQKHPEYADPKYGVLSDLELGQKIKAKFPKDYSDFQDISFGRKAEEFGIGALKGLGATARGAAKFSSFGLSELNPAANQKNEALLKTENQYQRYGKTTEQVAEGFVPIPGLSAIKAARSAPLLTRMAVGAGREALDVGLRTAAQTGSLKEGAEGAAFGGALGAAVPLFGKVLEAGAKRQYGRILHPEGRAAREVTEAKLLPREGEGVKGVGSLTEQTGVMGVSRSALAKKFEQRAQGATAEMNRAYTALGPQAQVKLRPILNDLAQFIRQNAMLPNGTIPKPTEKLYQQALEYGNRLITDTGGSIDKASVEDVRRFRQFLDKELYGRKLQINPTTAEDRVQQELRGSIQKQIHSQHPSTEAVDAAVHFWGTARDLMKRARPFAAEGGSGQALKVGARSAVGGLVGEEYGRRTQGAAGALEYGLLGTAATAMLDRAFASVAWNSVAAVTKTRIAQFLASGQGQKAADLAARVTGTQVLRKAQ